MPEQLVECVGCWFSGQRVKAARIVDPEEPSGSEEHATSDAANGTLPETVAQSGGGHRVTALSTGRKLPDAGPEVCSRTTLVHVQ